MSVERGVNGRRGLQAEGPCTGKVYLIGKVPQVGSLYSISHSKNENQNRLDGNEARSYFISGTG